jgi:nascent polypeptide-associated complex subunit alpha
MLPGLGGLNPKKMQAMMKQLGIKQEEIDSSRVIIETDEGNIIIENPNVTKVIMQGQETWQISGDSKEESNEEFSEEDVKLVMEKTGKSKEEVKKTLEKVNGEVAEAIIKLNL